MVQRKKDDWDLSNEVDSKALIDKSVTKFNNMKKQNIWIYSDSKDSKIIALTTKDNILQILFYFSMSDGGGEALVKIIFTMQEMVGRRIFLNGSVLRREDALNRTARHIGKANITHIKTAMVDFIWTTN